MRRNFSRVSELLFIFPDWHCVFVHHTSPESHPYRKVRNLLSRLHCVGPRAFEYLGGALLAGNG